MNVGCLVGQDAEKIWVEILRPVEVQLKAKLPIVEDEPSKPKGILRLVGCIKSRARPLPHRSRRKMVR